jgi:hypothetical protein
MVVRANTLTLIYICIAYQFQPSDHQNTLLNWLYSVYREKSKKSIILPNILRASLANGIQKWLNLNAMANPTKFKYMHKVAP